MKRNIIICFLSLIILAVALFGFDSKQPLPPSDYLIIEASDAGQLIKEVKTKLGQGFECVGGVSVYREGNRTHFVQAMQG